MHILFLSYFYPPNGSVGGMRGRHLSLGLVRRAHTVDVVAASPTPSQLDTTRFPAADPAGLTVTRCGRAATLAQAAGRALLRGRLTGPTSTAPNSGGPSPALASVLGFLRSDYAPEPQAIWNPEAFRTALAVAGRRKPDVVFCSGRPFASFRVAAALSQKLGVPLILDMRDPWSLLEHNTGWLRTCVRVREAPLLDRADAVIVNTAACAAAYTAEYGARLARKLVAIPNGIGDAVPPPPLSTGAPLRLLHAGNVYRRSLTPLLLAIERVEARLGRGLCAFRQVGTTDADTFDPPLVHRLGPAAQLHPRVPFADLRAHVAWSTVSVVLLGNDHYLRIPAKFYECLAARRPILFLGPRDHEVVAILDELGLGVAADSSDPEDIEAALLTLRAEIIPRLARDPVSARQLEPFLFSARADELADTLEHVVRTGRVNGRTQPPARHGFTLALDRVRRAVGHALAFVQARVFGVPPEVPLPGAGS